MKAKKIEWIKQEPGHYRGYLLGTQFFSIIKSNNIWYVYGYLKGTKNTNCIKGHWEFSSLCQAKRYCQCVLMWKIVGFFLEREE